MSWWVGLSRDELAVQIRVREEGWKRQKVGLLDTIGQRLRDGWEPRTPPRHPCGAIE